MPGYDELMTFHSALRAVQNVINQFANQGVIIGGIAVSLLGKPRLTADVDAILLASIEQIPEILRIARGEGILPRINDVIPFARKTRVLLLNHQESGADVDISLGILPFEIEVIERSIAYQYGDLLLRLPTIEDLIILKAVANRPKDLQDIRELTISHPNLDKQRIFYWVSQFAEALESPDILVNLNQSISDDK